MTGWIPAGLYGLLSASGLLAGAVAALWIPTRHRTIAAVTAVGVGLLIAAASLYLISAALMAVSAMMAASGALAGAASFSLVNLMLRRWSAEKRKRCGECVRQPGESDMPGSGLAIAAGSRWPPIKGVGKRRVGAPRPQRFAPKHGKFSCGTEYPQSLRNRITSPLIR